jgi:quinol monooxygenase YgiN
LTTLPFDPARRPELRYRIDTFTVPEPARAELEATMRRNMDFIRTLPGFLGHVAFEKRTGPGRFDLVTVAAWESAEAMERASVAVRAHYQTIGLDLPALLTRWGVTMERGDFAAPERLQ